MTTFFELSGFARGMYTLWSFIIMMLSIYMSLSMIRKRKKFRTIVWCGILTMACSIFHLFFSVNINLLEEGENLNLWGRCPVWVNCLVLGSGTVAIFVIVHWDRFTSRESITPMSVKESIDSLPAGICCFYRDGMIVMENPFFMEIAKRMTGKKLINATVFFDGLKDGKIKGDWDLLSGGEEPVVRFPEGQIYSFNFHELTLDGKNLYEIIIYDISESYIKTEVIREKNESLKAVNARLREYGDIVSTVTREREILNTKVALHDKMNQILLTTRFAIENPIDADRDKLFSLWRDNILLFKPSDTSVWEDPSLDLQQAADSIGIKLKIRGKFPENKEWIHVIMYAAGECMINALRHANASYLSMDINELGVTFTNDGTPPEGYFSEGGGLSTIRKNVEAIGGRMRVSTSPMFCVKIFYS